jgi:hypothetical protein
MTKYNLYYILVILIILVIIFYILNYFLNKNTKEYFNNSLNNNKYCCFYVYYEKDDLYKSNFEYFLQNGGILEDIDYYIIINGESTVEIPQLNNIKVFKRENKGYDFGAYSYGINQLNKEYDYYFFLNTSVKGPYLNEENKSKKWNDIFIDLFDKDIDIVGTSINIFRISDFEGHNLENIYNHNAPFPHVQSMFFCITNDYLKYLKSINFFDEEDLNNTTDMNKIIAYKEFGLSQNAIKRGKNINCILSKYKGLDYRIIKEDINKTSDESDPYYKGNYFGKSIDPYEVVFYKNNRI